MENENNNSFNENEKTEKTDDQIGNLAEKGREMIDKTGEAANKMLDKAETLAAEMSDKHKHHYGNCKHCDCTGDKHHHLDKKQKEQICRSFAAIIATIIALITFKKIKNSFKKKKNNE